MGYITDSLLHPQTLKVLDTRAYALDLDLKIDNLDNFKLDNNTCGFMFQYQYPDMITRPSRYFSTDGQNVSV